MNDDMIVPTSRTSQISTLDQNRLHRIIKRLQMIDRIINNLRLLYSPLIPDEKLIEAYTSMRQCAFLESAYIEAEISPILN